MIPNILRFGLAAPAVTLSVLVSSVVSSAVPVAGLEVPPASEAPSFELADRAASQLPRLRSLIINWNGERLFEGYYNGAAPGKVANIKSASKSVMSALVGIAIDRGFLDGVDQSIHDFFPDILAHEDSLKQSITIEDLLTMRSGLETTSNRNYGAWVATSNWVRSALLQPLRYEPGARMIYSTGNTHLLSAILTQATGMNTWRFAQQHLARPLGFSLAPWTRDPQGIYFGGNEMGMTPDQMVAFGELYLNEGRREGRQILPAAWVDATFVARTASPRERGRFYGYGWWVRDLGGYAAHYAWGYGGQFIFVIPGLDLVVVTTSDSTPSDDRRGHNQRIYEMVEDLIVVPIATSSSL